MPSKKRWNERIEKRKKRKKLTQKQQEAWPISLKIITELYECITLPLPPAAAASPEMPPCRPPPSKDECHTKGEGGGGKTTKSETTTTKISVSTSKEWDPASEEAVRRIVRNILVEIMGGGSVLNPFFSIEEEPMKFTDE